MWSELFKRWMDMLSWWLPGQGDDRSGERDEPAPRQTQTPQRPTAVKSTPASQDTGTGTPAAASTPSGSGTTDDLTAIKGIGAATRDRLAGLGIHGFADLATADADQLTAQLKNDMVISRNRVQQWIDAAAAHTGGR